MKTVLVAEDDVAMLRLYQLQLKRAGYQGYYYANATDAIAALPTVRPDLAVLDYDLPDHNGVSILEAMRTTGTNAVPVVFITGQGKASIREELLAAGAMAVFSKPFSPALLIGKIRELIGS